MARINAIPGGGKTNGTASADEIYGSYLGDIIFAGGGNDIINAGFGNDSINGGAGADTIDGGAGNDTVSYSNAPASSANGSGVVVSLHESRGAFSDAEGDTYTGIENVTGSNYSDIIFGDGGNNVLNGLDGGDYIRGGAGADSMDGGAGIDTLVYTTQLGNVPASPTGVTVNLLTGTGSGGDAQGDTFQNFENVAATGLADTVIGSNGDNKLEGFNGNDVLFGNGGTDTLFGGEDNDILDGGAGNDTLEGHTGNDTLTGGIGVDTFVFAINTDFNQPGNDRIADFQDGVDRIRLEVDNAPNGMAELTFTQLGNSALISFDDGGSVLLSNINISQLTAADFEFV